MKWSQVFLMFALVVVANLAGALAFNSGSNDEAVEIWLVVDGVAIGTVEPGSLEYDHAAGVIQVSSNELIYGCRQDRIFRDRFQVVP